MLTLTTNMIMGMLDAKDTEIKNLKEQNETLRKQQPIIITKTTDAPRVFYQCPRHGQVTVEGHIDSAKRLCSQCNAERARLNKDADPTLPLSFDSWFLLEYKMTFEDWERSQAGSLTSLVHRNYLEFSRKYMTYASIFAARLAAH